jgi:CHAT domain-containing protein
MNLSEKHPVICTIACDSGVQDVGAGDEPFGLVPALFCAGASSVVGTLWPIRSDTGRLFSHHFYAHLKKQIESDEGKKAGSSERPVVNIAAAFREATLQVKRVKPDPYSWAAFTMNGAGFSC